MMTSFSVAAICQLVVILAIILGAAIIVNANAIVGVLQ